MNFSTLSSSTRLFPRYHSRSGLLTESEPPAQTIPAKGASSGTRPTPIQEVSIKPNSSQESDLFQKMAQQPYGAKPVLMMNELNVKPNPELGELQKRALGNGAVGYLQQVKNRPTTTLEFILPLFPDNKAMHLSNNILLNGTLKKKELLQDLRSRGIGVDTFVTQDRFTLVLIGPSGRERELIETGLGFLAHPDVDKKGYESDRTIVMQNLLNLSNKPDFQKAESIQRARVGDKHPYAKSTLQTIMEVKDLQPEETIQQFRASYAHPEMTQVSMVSGLSVDSQEALLNHVAQQKGWLKDEVVAPPTATVKVPPVQSKTITHPILIADDRLSREHMSTIWKAPKVEDPDYPAFIVMKHLMGGMTGSLFKTMRTERGLVYSTSSGVEANKNYGEYEVSAEIDVDKLDSALVGLDDAISTYVKAPPDKVELAKVKRRIIHNMREQETTSSGIISVASTRLRDGLEPLSREVLKKRYMDVTAEDVQKVANKYLGKEAWHVQAFTGPRDVLQEHFPNVPISEREHYLTDNVAHPQEGNIYVKKGEDGPMVPAQLMMEPETAKVLERQEASNPAKPENAG
jgi:predicted Zn-dependent peptidase